MQCPRCDNPVYRSTNGTIICLRCGYTNLPSSKRQGRVALLAAGLRPYLQNKYALGILLAIALIGIGGLTVVALHGSQAIDESKTPPTSQKVTAKKQSPNATVAEPSPSAPTPTPPPPKATTAPAATPPPSYVITNTLCQVDARQAPDQLVRAKEMATTCATVFPEIESRLSASPYGPIHQVVFDENQYAAYSSAGVVHVSISWLRNSPYDPGLLPHELTHVIQGYGSNAPGWITEGIATYMSYKLGYSIGIAHCNAGESYTSGYGCGASLFNYIERVYRPSIVRDIHRSIKNQTYTNATFTSETGKSLSQLYSECLKAECKGGTL